MTSIPAVVRLVGWIRVRVLIPAKVQTHKAFHVGNWMGGAFGSVEATVDRNPRHLVKRCTCRSRATVYE